MIRTDDPWHFTHATIYSMVALVIVGLVWSFFGHADVLDVLVTAGARWCPRPKCGACTPRSTAR